jgi:cyclic pyranopterin phosphate synthase
MLANLKTLSSENSAPVLRDSFGRTITNLRISVTDRCNFRCRYCMPEEGLVWMEKGELLTYEEIERLTVIFSELGINKVRLTGGEPLLRRDLHLLIKMISDIQGIKDLSLTTNGYLLDEQAKKLVDAGLNRINISLDSLNQTKFNIIARRNHFNRVWKGIETAEALGINPIKINVVLIRGINNDEILNFANLAREHSLIIRFIEFMPIGAGDGWSNDKVVTSEEIIQIMENGLQKKLIQLETTSSQAAEQFIFEDGIGEIGFISSVSQPFCSHCNRVRITSDGKLRTCLFSQNETDLKRLIRENATTEEIKNILIDRVWNKEVGHMINRPGFVRPFRTMSQIGG